MCVFFIAKGGNEVRKRGFEVVSRYEEGTVKLPVCSTRRAAGYDFFAVEEVIVPSLWKEMMKAFKVVVVERFRPVYNGDGTSDAMERYGSPEIQSCDEGNFHIGAVEVKTGVKVYMEEDEVLMIHNRSSNPVKRLLVLAEGVGVVDADYYNSEETEGEVMFHFWNFGLRDRVIKRGDRIGQGVFQKFLKADKGAAQESDDIRKGGHGSTLD